jgi:O-antigen/teichoic acid export membrane protein
MPGFGHFHAPRPQSRAVTRTAADLVDPSSARGLARGIGQVLASQIALALVGFSTLPILGRRLGLAEYGDFSLFVLLLGAVTYQDVARQLLIHERAKERATPEEFDALTRLSTLLIVVLSALVGALALPPLAACGLTLCALLHGAASRDFAELSAAGRVGAVASVRNFAWAGAFAASCALSFAFAGPAVYVAPFVLALGATLAVYRRIGLPRAPLAPEGSGARWWSAVSGWARLRRSEHWPHYRKAGLELLGFTIASSTIAVLDRVLLERTAGADELGLYCGAADLATRVHVVSSAIAATLYPMLAALVHQRGIEHAARRFVAIASALVSLYFLGLLAMLALDRELLALFLGPAFASSRPLFDLMLIGIFLHAFGFLLTPWQRARGDFATQRDAYVRAAVVMALVGVVAVPLYGAIGALAAYLASRIAEVQLVAVEMRRMSAAILPRRKLAAALAMLAMLSFLAFARFWEAA